MGQTKNWPSKKSRKIAFKKTSRTNIIATNFGWEQLKREVSVRNYVSQNSSRELASGQRKL